MSNNGQANGGTNIDTLLQQLREDHRNMAVLLKLLEEETAKARRGGDPDFELLNDIMHYMTVYSDAVHHPTEDIIYRKLAAAGAEYSQGLEQVGVQHRDLEERGKHLKEECEAAVSGVAVVRDRFIDEATRYVELLMKHMHWEESDLFRRAERLAEEKVEVADVAANDPVFGVTPDAQFQSLLERLRAAVDR